MIRQIKYFQTVVRCNSFTKAADECYISQSAISQQIQALENELGVKLLNRDHRKISLTPAGEYFYKNSLDLISDFETLCKDTIRIANNDQEELRIGYLRCYSGHELHLAVSEFSQKYPELSVRIINGNHEELYDELRNGNVDLILSDQRRAFSDEYVNYILATSECYIEMATRNDLSTKDHIEITDLQKYPCILVSSPEQQDIEKEYYRDVVGIQGDFLFANNLEEARLMVIGENGFMPVEGIKSQLNQDIGLKRILLTRNNKPIKRTYCAFWKENNSTENSTENIETFAKILKSRFI